MHGVDGFKVDDELLIKMRSAGTRFGPFKHRHVIGSLVYLTTTVCYLLSAPSH